jgi:phosphoribosylaminoimidazolecarboxamide formyltransferase / IMP cyclohydrolase
MSPKRIRRALISVSDKAGLIEFARRLSVHSVELVSTGGTAEALRKAGLDVRDVSSLTGFPEILGGRVKTLHPKVHGGILAIRENQDHSRQVAENQIEYIDMVVVNLYPFVQIVSRADASVEQAIENIDIGGPSMIRSAAKNFRDVAVVTDPADYPVVADDMDRNRGSVSLETRTQLARRAFEITARYDQAIAEYFADSLTVDDTGSVSAHQHSDFPTLFLVSGRKKSDLRYGENPHQRAALYVDVDAEAEGGVATADKLQGKELSYNNLIDLDAAWALVSEFQDTGCAIIKHTNPCGAATASDPAEAFEKAMATDPVSAFGGIIAFNRPVTEGAASLISKTFFEAIVAPDYEAAAIEVLSSRKNLRLLRIRSKTPRGRGYDLRVIGGGFLAQDRDQTSLDESSLRVVSARQPTGPEMQALRFAWIIAKHVKSNAIVYAREGQLVGVGAGQMSRVDSVKIGAMKAVLPLAGAVLASDAFFPFRDGIDEAAKTGITAVIQPGGSVRDNEVIEAANEHNLSMVFTGMRHFKH